MSWLCNPMIKQHEIFAGYQTIWSLIPFLLYTNLHIDTSQYMWIELNTRVFKQDRKGVKSINCFCSNTKFTILSSASYFKNYLSAVSIKNNDLFPTIPIMWKREAPPRPSATSRWWLPSPSSNPAPARTCVGVTAWVWLRRGCAALYGCSSDLCGVVWVWLRRGGVILRGCKFGVDVRPYMDVSLVRMRIPSPVLLIPRSRTRWWFATGAKARPWPPATMHN